MDHKPSEELSANTVIRKPNQVHQLNSNSISSFSGSYGQGQIQLPSLEA
jgi:hypothetical protein